MALKGLYAWVLHPRAQSEAAARPAIHPGKEAHFLILKPWSKRQVPNIHLVAPWGTLPGQRLASPIFTFSLCLTPHRYLPEGAFTCIGTQVLWVKPCFFQLRAREHPVIAWSWWQAGGFAFPGPMGL